jgi:hypothetical protein
MTPPTDDQIKAIDSLLEEIYQQQCLTKAVLKERNTVVENLEQFLKKIIPGNNRGWNVLITITGLQSTRISSITCIKNRKRLSVVAPIKRNPKVNENAFMQYFKY